MKAQRIEELQRSVESLRQNMELMSEILARQPTVRVVEKAIELRRRKSAEH